ncbi:ribosome biogenesis GTP-binding protein YihA/YsxC [Novosphingobium sp. SL115]|jgi:GTP-binding protein|uniref:ribosome biogenesis GTP-binding protein YihA/YsxC n=1 Tax=Novosphingobium sp. SL115 TaxID=2995150 RepID=UPI0022764417|nr:ribosome biogenesis GTP-binding protein YihA/YsxC [Novosphingobium sp. SL115]MCY1670096.1 ribosome biogenesis GTP-binding protein YihA/YsxC [Novosphingobium sp. SL115]
MTPEEQAAQAEMIERARLLFAGRVEFIKSAPALKFLPDPDVPEIAFAGRSNVGKSSLLNALTGRKSIARTSVTPGRTQELNYFEVGEPTRLRLVDMPGYGFAKAPPKVVETWRRLVRDYLRGRVVLKRTLLLIDSRHGVKPVDSDMMQMLDEAGVGYRVVLTKADKIKASELERVTEETIAAARKRTAAYPDIIVTSSEVKMGIAELRAAVLQDSEG